MLIGQTQPLELARRVLQPETISSIRECQEIHLRGWKILDRWAFNSPQKLRELEKSGEILLLGRLLEQQKLEHAVLLEATEAMNAGTSEQELLEMNHVRTELL
jgi:hypothetical protein